MKILVIEDDEKTADFITKGLSQENFTSDRATDGRTGLMMALDSGYAAAIVDVMLPKLDGISLVKLLREAGCDLPIIILSARSTVDDRVLGLKAGSDDYLVKPFAFSELLARLHAIMRRPPSMVEELELVVADLKLDLVKRRVFRGTTEIIVPPLEFTLLAYLMRNTGRLVSRTMIMENVWDYNFDPETNVVDTRICRLREKIDRAYATKLIHTVRGSGYVLEAR